MEQGIKRDVLPGVLHHVFGKGPVKGVGMGQTPVVDVDQGGLGSFRYFTGDGTKKKGVPVRFFVEMGLSCVQTIRLEIFDEDIILKD